MSCPLCACHQARKFGRLQLSDTSDDSPNILVFQVCGYRFNEFYLVLKIFKDVKATGYLP